MRKILNKFLAVFVSFVMAITMIPLSGIVSHAETTVGDQSTVKTYYEKVSNPTTLVTGDEVLITYGTKALVANSDGNLGEDDIGSSDKLTKVPDGSVWKVTKSNSKYYFKTDKRGNKNTLNVNRNSISLGSDGNPLTVTSEGKIYLVRGYTDWRKDYAITYDSGFTGTEDEGASSSTAFTFYKKVQDKVKLTINYKLDENTPSKVEKEVKAGDTVDINDSFPSGFGNVDDYEVEKIEYNGSNIGTDNQIKVNGDAEITAYYKKADKVNFTVKYYVNGIEQSDSFTKSVKKGIQTVSIPEKYNQYTFNKMIINDVEQEKKTTFDVKSDTTIAYYYTDLNAPDAVEPDGDLNGPAQPEYPNQGAVKTSKTASDTDFPKTGLTRVELGVTGVPLKQGTDVVLVIDVSGSMAWDVDGKQTTDNTKKRITIAKDSAKQFVNQLFANNEDGSKSNNRVSVVIFSSSGYTNGILCSLKNVDNKQTVIDAIDGISNNPTGGTDYDNAMTMAEQVLETVKDTTRNKAVLFMSDGAPENGYNGKTGYDIYPDAFKAHEKSSEIKNNYGATIYTVSFGLKGSQYKELTEDRCRQILRDYMASNENCYKNANSKEDLENAFTNIATAIRKAGTNAVVTDVIGDDFSLQMGNKYPSGVKETFPSDYDTSIKILSYSQVDDEGNGTGTPEVIETVTFSEDGTSATSDKKEGNIISGNKIIAENFVYDMNTKTFTWTIGDITSAKIVLSFVEYLNGSMNGQASEKTDYHTNKEATLNYTNYQGIDNQTLPFDDPTLPWGKASVNVVYYLVNENGEPVNSAGNKVDFAWRKEVYKTEPISVNLNTQEKIINASEYKPEGYELHNTNAYYTVRNIGSDNASIDKSNDNSTKVVGDFPYITSTVYFGVLAKTDLQEDTVVLDYGKPVTVDVRANDGFKSATLNSVSKVYDDSEVALNTGTSYSLQEGFKAEESNKYGTLKVKDENKVTYTPNKYMDGIDKYYYAVKGQTTKEGQNVDAYKYSSVSIIPATSVYYEDNFGGTGTTTQTGGIYFNKDVIQKVGTDNNTDNTKEQSDKNTNYGNDASYDNDATDSNGSSTKITGNGAATATFTFTGTGFDLVGRTTNETGDFLINVYTVDSNGNKKDRISSEEVKTKYQNGSLYQIPVYNWNCSEWKDSKGNAYTHGKYFVEIKVARDEIFYLDAVRIYNPIDTSKNTEDATTAKDAYEEALESNPQVNEVRELLLTQKTSTNFGAVFVNTDGAAGFDKFKEIGPNNEVYLAPGQSIGFEISSDKVPATIQIGAKAPNGEATFTAYTDDKTDTSKNVPVGTKTLKTATDMYYKLDTSKIKFVNGKAYIMVSNTGNNNNIVSITNIKLTFNAPASNAKPNVSFEATQEVIEKTKARTLALNKAKEPVKILNAKFTTDFVKVNKESTLIVTTNSNAKDITILDNNGNKVTPTSKSSKLNSDGNKVFTVTIKHTIKGTNSYTIIANGEEGKTSESVNVSINVKKQTLLDMISSWFK